MNNKPIGILDSGVGGLTVLKDCIHELPHESFVYIGDSLNAPYGAKTTEEIYQLSKRLINFLLEKEAKLIVIACNTITVSCIDRLRADYPDIPIVGTVPVVKTAVSVSKNKRIGILSTKRTAESAYQRDLIEKFADGCTVFSHGTDALVPLIEQGKLEGPDMNEVLDNILSVFQQERIDTLALGCSHFPLVRKLIQEKLGPEVQLLDSGAAIARQVHRILEKNEIVTDEQKPSYRLSVTGHPKFIETAAHNFFGESVQVAYEKVTLNS